MYLDTLALHCYLGMFIDVLRHMFMRVVLALFYEHRRFGIMSSPAV